LDTNVLKAWTLNQHVVSVNYPKVLLSDM